MEAETPTTKHTPGPWWIKNSHGPDKYIPNVFSGEDTWRAIEICTLYGAGSDNGYRAECEANANLIAAAPDLLEGAKLAIKATGGSANWNGDTKAFLEIFERAIAKAESVTA